MSTHPTRIAACLVLVCFLTGPVALAGPDVPLERMMTGVRQLSEFGLSAYRLLAPTIFTVGVVRLLFALLSSRKANSKQTAR